MYFRLSFPCNPKGAYCHRVCIENYHAWQISNQSSVRTCEDDLTILRVNHASTGAKRHVPSFELPHKLVLQCDVSFQCSHDGNVATSMLRHPGDSIDVNAFRKVAFVDVTPSDCEDESLSMKGIERGVVIPLGVASVDSHVTAG